MAGNIDINTLEGIRQQKAILSEQILKQKNVLRRKARSLANSLSENPLSTVGFFNPLNLMGLGKISTFGLSIFKGVQFGLKILKALRKVFR